MKLLKYLTGLAVAMALTACGGGGGSAGTVSGSDKELPLSVAAPNPVTVAPGGASSFAIMGGLQPYSAVSDNPTIAQVAIDSNNRLTVGGLLEGATQVQVRDARATVVSLSVNVSRGPVVALFTTAPNALTMTPGSAQNFTIGGGRAPYVVTSGNVSVATASLAGSVLTINALTGGTTNLQIFDALNATATVTVNVVSAAGALAVTPSAASTAIIGDRVQATVTGGLPPYRVSVGNFDVARASIAGNLLTVTPTQTGQTVITIFDSENKSVPFALTANAGQPTIRLSPSVLTVSEVDNQNIVLNVFGASGALTAFSSDLTLLQATIAGNTVVVGTGTSGSRCVASDSSVTITVLDAGRAVATAVVTIKNNGNTPAVIGVPAGGGLPAVVAVSANNCPP